jgi:MFS family permease
MTTDNIPPLRFKTHWYGWVIVLIAALAMIATFPGRTHGLGIITERLLADKSLDMTRTSYANLNLWATLLGGLFCIPCGWLLDRLGLRIMLSLTVAFLAGSVFGMTRAHNSNEFFLWVLLTRGFGQSALSVISITMVGKWFPNRITWPMAIYSLILSMGFAMSFDYAKYGINDDWRVVWNIVGYCLLAFLPIALIFTFEPPRYIKQEEELLGVNLNVGQTLAQAMRTSTFWVFSLAISLIALIGSGISLFQESVLTTQGFQKELYYDVMKYTFLITLLFKLPIGWLGQRVSLNYMLAFGLGLNALCLMILPHIHTKAGIMAYAVGMGLSGSITTVLFFSIWGEAFGRAHLGTIQAVAQMMTVLASALGPSLFALCFEHYKNYNLAFQCLSCVAATIAIWACFIRIPTPSVITLDEKLIPEPSA